MYAHLLGNSLEIMTQFVQGLCVFVLELQVSNCIQKGSPL
jgi:hypothetical protein